MSLVPVVQFVGGLCLLVLGAEGLVRGASRLALAIGVPALIVGLIIVAPGTSLPELTVSAYAAIEGRDDLAVANVVGSNIFNVLLILGISALIRPLRVSRRMVWIDVPVMIGASLLLLALGADGRMSRLEAALLLGALPVYLAWSVRAGRREGKATSADGSAPLAGNDRPAGSDRPGSPRAWAVNLALIGGGLILLVVGTRLLIDAAVAIARAFGMSEMVIGLTIVAAGTSLPEVATSVIAAIRRQSDIAVANVVGSSTFNILGILGLSGVAARGGLRVADSMVRFDIPVMLAVAIACLPFTFTGHRLARWEGAVLFGYYLAYTLYLVLEHTRHDLLPLYSAAMLAFALPLTFMTLVVITVREIRARRAAAR